MRHHTVNPSRLINTLQGAVDSKLIANLFGHAFPATDYIELQPLVVELLAIQPQLRSFQSLRGTQRFTKREHRAWIKKWHRRQTHPLTSVTVHSFDTDMDLSALLWHYFNHPATDPATAVDMFRTDKVRTAPARKPDIDPVDLELTELSA